MDQINTEKLSQVLISRDTTISEAILKLDQSGLGVLLICGEDQKLMGVLTDGDFRRAILRDIPFTELALKIACLSPITAQQGISNSDALFLMDHGKNFIVNHLPVINGNGKVIDLILRRDLIAKDNARLSAVIMAGGFGTRLRPLTEEIPKPMLQIGDRPIIERIVNQIKGTGIRRINITTHYKAEKIIDYLGNGSEFGVDINYIPEDRPLGTAGALGLMPVSDETILVINGDILTQVNLQAILDYHRENSAEMTVAVRQYDVKVPYGVVECEGSKICQIKEKPALKFFVNAGIYLIEPTIFKYIIKGSKMDMTDLISTLIDKNRKVISFPIVEYWLDIGQLDDYKRAQLDVQKWRCMP